MEKLAKLMAMMGCQKCRSSLTYLTYLIHDKSFDSIGYFDTIKVIICSVKQCS